MLSIITDKILTHKVTFDIANLSPPLATSAINQIAPSFFYSKLYIGGALALFGIVFLKKDARKADDKNGAYLIFRLFLVPLTTTAILYGAKTWYLQRNFQQILLPQLQKIADGNIS